MYIIGVLKGKGTEGRETILKRRKFSRKRLSRVLACNILSQKTEN